MPEDQWQNTDDHQAAPAVAWENTDDHRSGALSPAPASWSQPKPTPPRSGGQKVLDYTTEMLSNVPGSGWKFLENVYHGVRHPIDTGQNLAEVVTGTLQKMTPDTPSHRGRELVPHADAALDALKKRYGSPAAFAKSFHDDPVGVSADIAAVVGGVSGAAKIGGMTAARAGLPRVASAADAIADTAATISDAANPMNLVTKPVGYVSKAVAKGLVRKTLGVGGRKERHGATPATAALEHTSGFTPAAVQASAIARLTDLNQQLEQLAAFPNQSASLRAIRKVLEDEIKKVKGANGLTGDLEPMLEQVTEARPGFQGSVDPATGQIAETQSATDFLAMKRQFGDDFTKFDAAVPMRSSARNLGNRAYHEMSTEFNRVVPGAQPINQEMQSLVPVREGAQRAGELAGPTERIVDRATRPTGGLAATLLGFMHGGTLGALAALGAQELLASPTAKMITARTAYGAGKGVSSPITSRTLNAAGVASSIPPAPPPTTTAQQAPPPAAAAQPAPSQPAAQPIAQANTHKVGDTMTHPDGTKWKIVELLPDGKFRAAPLE